MATLVKLATIEHPLFSHLGMEITDSWGAFDLEKLDAEQLAALKLYRGRIFQVHPADVEAFEEVCGGLPESPTLDDSDDSDDDTANADAPKKRGRPKKST
jgi:hypothetical protein